jgi:hypothetical protein
MIWLAQHILSRRKCHILLRNFKNQIAKWKTKNEQAQCARFLFQTSGYRVENKKGQYVKGVSKSTRFWSKPDSKREERTGSYLAHLSTKWLTVPFGGAEVSVGRTFEALFSLTGSWLPVSLPNR